MNNKWDKRFLDLAEHISTWSKDPSTKVGTVIARGKRVLSLGFNGFPEGVADTAERLGNRDIKYQLVVHGEINALNYVDGELHNCTLYNIPFMPCARCAGSIIQRKIKRVVSFRDENPRWIESFKLTEDIFKEAGVELILLDKNEKS